MRDSRWIWPLATRFPGAFSGSTLHRFGLESQHHGDGAMADLLFEAAAARYRVELAVESLARLRVHQRIGRVRMLPASERRSRLALEVEQSLSLLDTIEALSPPFERVPAHALLATWLDEGHDVEQAAATTARAA
jgi:hypothetical protein